VPVAPATWKAEARGSPAQELEVSLSNIKTLSQKRKEKERKEIKTPLHNGGRWKNSWKSGFLKNALVSQVLTKLLERIRV
jgi:hypothetical protein